MSKIMNLHAAKKNKNDEFYTQLPDIEKELKHYKQHFKNKVVFCNCDDPEWSNFWKYFEMNFEHLGLKKLVATHYEKEGSSYKLEMFRDENGECQKTKVSLQGNGDFKSPECVEILRTADIVVTNPPFSLFREYVAQLIKFDKKFIIIGSQNAISYKEIFPLIKNNQLWLGVNSNVTLEFKVPEYYELTGSNCRIDEQGEKYVSVAGIQWFTNLDNQKRHEELIMYKTYNEVDYLKYDNYDAIEVGKVKEIPIDYDGVMGVPITFLSVYNPEQFKILGIAAGSKDTVGIPFLGDRLAHPLINGLKKYARIFIQKKRG